MVPFSVSRCRFDIIFCRNVAIYFGDRDRMSLFSRLERSLDRDGYLIIGAMESLSTVCPQLEPKRHLRSVYYQSRTLPVGTPGATRPVYAVHP